jgi:hypothetical protein
MEKYLNRDNADGENETGHKEEGENETRYEYRLLYSIQIPFILLLQI